MKYNRGFTLIELMTVISIIGFLSSIVTSSLNNAKNRARDSAMRQEVQEYRNAFELYKADHNGMLPQISVGYYCLGQDATYCLLNLASRGPQPTKYTSPDLNTTLNSYINGVKSDTKKVKISGGTSMDDVELTGIVFECTYLNANSTCAAGYIRWNEITNNGSRCGVSNRSVWSYPNDPWVWAYYPPGSWGGLCASYVAANN